MGLLQGHCGSLVSGEATFLDSAETQLCTLLLWLVDCAIGSPCVPSPTHSEVRGRLQVHR